MEPWYKIVQPRSEVREGRSFNPDEFAIHLEQVVSGAAPDDYKNPIDFFARTCFTAALREHMGMVLRRLNGETVNAAPVLTLIYAAYAHKEWRYSNELRKGGVSVELRTLKRKTPAP